VSRLGLGNASKEAQRVQTPERNTPDWSQCCPVTTDVADVTLWLFFRTRQLNVTCDNLVDGEVFLHYSLIPSVSKGSGAQERGH